MPVNVKLVKTGDVVQIITEMMRIDFTGNWKCPGRNRLFMGGFFPLTGLRRGIRDKKVIYTTEHE